MVPARGGAGQPGSDIRHGDDVLGRVGRSQGRETNGDLVSRSGVSGIAKSAVLLRLHGSARSGRSSGLSGGREDVPQCSGAGLCAGAERACRDLHKRDRRAEGLRRSVRVGAASPRARVMRKVKTPSGTLYRAGHGVPRDYKEAMRLFRLAAARATRRADKYRWGVLFRRGLAAGLCGSGGVVSQSGGTGLCRSPERPGRHVR